MQPQLKFHVSTIKVNVINTSNKTQPLPSFTVLKHISGSATPPRRSLLVMSLQLPHALCHRSTAPSSLHPGCATALPLMAVFFLLDHCMRPFSQNPWKVAILLAILHGWLTSEGAPQVFDEMDTQTKV
ncbi:hypothetical protein SESBI_38727 [Sesbania bispinosa]|nr:hypothetical protein SESBI_38727 [Sesbania bispinosa]